MLVLNEYGLLTPGGLIETSLADVERRFVADMPLSLNRVSLFERTVAYINDVKCLVNSEMFYWIDGSFVTAKLNPKDVDLVLFTEHTIYNQLNRELDQLRSTQKPSIDSYFVPTYPTEHKKHRLFELSYIEWLYVFGTTRDYRNKGILSLKA